MNKHSRGFTPGVWDMTKKFKYGNTSLPVVVIGAWGVLVDGRLVPSVFNSKAEAHALALRLGEGAIVSYLSIRPALSYEESLYD